MARIAIGYTTTCILYLLLTRNIGTPFMDTLTDEQQRIRQTSSTQRTNVFLISSIMSVALLKLWRPLRT